MRGFLHRASVREELRTKKVSFGRAAMTLGIQQKANAGALRLEQKEKREKMARKGGNYAASDDGVEDS